MVGVDRQRPPKAVSRLGRLPLVFESVAKIIERVGLMRIYFHRSSEANRARL